MRTLLALATMTAVLTAQAGPAAAQTPPPRVVSVDVIGAERTRRATVADLVGLAPGDLLTAEARARAERRLRQWPGVSRADLRYVLDEDRQAEVRAIVHEKPMFPNDMMDWGGIGARVILKEEVKVSLAGLAGLGDVTTLAWRWEAHRPRVIAEFALPAPGPLPGVLAVDTLFEDESYALTTTDPALALVTEPRRRAGASLSDWATPWLRWHAGGAADRIAGRNHVAIDGGLDIRLMEDLVAPGVSVGRWQPAGPGRAFTLTDVSVAWRADRETFPAYAGLLGVTVASAPAPFAVWPSAGTGGSGRGALLRAHPLHEHGIVTSENFARRLMYFTVEHTRPLPGAPFGNAAFAVFVDAGRAWAGLPGQPRRVNVDVGTGVRFGSGSGAVRFDVAFGLRDQQWGISAGWVDAWPWR